MNFCVVAIVLLASVGALLQGVESKKAYTALRQLHTHALRENIIDDEDQVGSGSEVNELVARGNWQDIKDLVKKAAERAEHTYGKKEELSSEEESKVSEETAKKRSWDDFKEELRKMKFKLKQKLGKRILEIADDEKDVDERESQELQQLKNALEELKQEAKHEGLENDPEFIHLIKDSEEMVHMLEDLENSL